MCWDFAHGHICRQNCHSARHPVLNRGKNRLGRLALQKLGAGREHYHSVPIEDKTSSSDWPFCIGVTECHQAVAHHLNPQAVAERQSFEMERKDQTAELPDRMSKPDGLAKSKKTTFRQQWRWLGCQSATRVSHLMEQGVAACGPGST